MKAKSRVTVKRTGRTWSVFLDGALHEGFFFKDTAFDAAATLRAEADQQDPGITAANAAFKRSEKVED